MAYARNIDNLGALASRVERIAQKHVGLSILPEHYPAVAEPLLGAIKDVLGDAATDDIMTALGEAYWLLADVLIARESSLYRELAAAPGGWNGWRNFIVEATQQESEIIRSFALVPADGGPVLRHRPGQYLTFALEIPEAGLVKRNYSISCAPNQRSYRISAFARLNTRSVPITSSAISGWTSTPAHSSKSAAGATAAPRRSPEAWQPGPRNWG